MCSIRRILQFRILIPYTLTTCYHVDLTIIERRNTTLLIRHITLKIKITKIISIMTLLLKHKNDIHTNMTNMYLNELLVVVCVVAPACVFQVVPPCDF